MANAIEVSDSRSNAPEHIEVAVKAIGRSTGRQRVFETIYHGKKRIKTVQEVMSSTNLSHKRVLNEGRHLVRKGIVHQTRKDGQTAYEKIDFFHVHKRQILSLAANPKKLARLPTKRNVVVKLPSSVKLPTFGAKATRVSIDDIDSFAKVRKVKRVASLPACISENAFKRAVQAIVGESGSFKDWGGERSDLFTTRLTVKRKRVAAAFAFKGPGQKGRLVPGRMGKNGDQAQRLIQEDADVFVVQHWREIDSSVLELMRSLAIAKSLSTGKQIWYGIIDGQDSERLRLAYPDDFSATS